MPRLARLVPGLAALALAGCISPGDYNINVGVGAPAPVATTAAVAGPGGSTQATGSAPAATPPAAVASGAGSLDQRQESASSFQQVGLGSRLAQSFSSPTGGTLLAVGLRLKASGANGQVAVVLRSTDGQGKPAEALAEGTLATASLGSSGADWSTVTLTPPIALAPAMTYALAITFAGQGVVYAGAASDTSYPGGTGLTGLTDGSTFWNKLGQDLAFRCYLAAPAIATSPSTAPGTTASTATTAAATASSAR